MEKVTLLNDRSLADRFLNERVFNRLFFQFSLVIFVWLLMPTRMIAQALVSDSRSDLITVDDGITIESITDVGDNPWGLLDFKAEGMDNIDITIPADSKGLMSSNYNKNIANLSVSSKSTPTVPLSFLLIMPFHLKEAGTLLSFIWIKIK